MIAAPSRQAVDFPARIRSAAHGLLDHGHLFGTVAYIVDLDDQVDELSADDAHRMLITRYVDGAPGHYHIRLHGVGQLVIARRLARFIPQLKPNAWVSISVRVPAPHLFGPLWVDSVAVVDRVDTDVDQLPSNIGSVSVEGWFGSVILEAIQARVDAYNGYYLIVDRDEYADARTWLEADGSPTWQLLLRPLPRGP